MIGMTIEILVVFLLVITIVYCVIVNRKLEALRSDQSELRGIITDLDTATGKAEAAIRSMRETAGLTDSALADRVARALDIESRLSEEIIKAEALHTKLSAIPQRVLEVPRPAAPAVPSLAGEFKHSQIGLGLLNADKRRAARDRDAA
ncbi:MAG: DUF6468 domain-containing protein [Hyphomicrobiales bacterium]